MEAVGSDGVVRKRTKEDATQDFCDDLGLVNLSQGKGEKGCCTDDDNL